jgi:feruloyl-CoA synthase
MSGAAQSSRLRPPPAPVRPVRVGPQDTIVTREANGIIRLRSPEPLAPYASKITERLEHWARVAPDRIYMAQRDAAGGWRTVTYAQALDHARHIGSALLKRNLSAERPLVILSGNDIEHALISLGALYIGVPHAPISPAYSLISGDFGRLRFIIELLTPGLIYATDGRLFDRAIDAVVPRDLEVVVARNAPADRKTTPFAELCAEPPSAAADKAHDAITPDTITKFLFTSGSTGIPKCVINTQRMWCSDQMMLRQALVYFADEPPVIVDWTPWHHTAGGNHDVGLILYNGGSMYIDEGKPLPGAIEETIRNLREIATTWYFTVPKGYEVMLPYLRSDTELRRTFFSRVKVLWFAGAALAQHVYDEVQELAVEACGERIPFLTGLGSTETAPCAFARTWESGDSTNMGLPVAGTECKLLPCDGKLEARVAGPNITPGYWRQPEFTANAFDEEGFYKLGDALRFADPDNPKEGLLFDGRIVEDFKLSTGTWVSVGPLRAKFIAHFAPHVRDVVIAGADRNELAALIIPAGPATDPQLHGKLTELLRSFAAKSTGSSNMIRRAIVLTELPSMDAGEMTDKGSINQRAVLSNRAALVEELYAERPSERVIIAGDKM